MQAAPLDPRLGGEVVGDMGRRTSPTSQPGLAWGHEQVTDGRSFTQFITNQLYWKNPTYVQ